MRLAAFLVLSAAVMSFAMAPLWGVPKAIIDLGSPDTATLMTHIQVGDGDTTPATIGSLTCRRNVSPTGDLYFYFGIDDSFAYQGSRPTMYITIHYYDTGTATLELHYDATSAAYKSGGTVTLTNTNTWKSKGFRVTDGYFGNRQNGGADFRMAGPSGTTYYLDLVYARDFCGPNPRVRIHPPPGRPTMNAQAMRDLMEHWDQWPVTRGLTQIYGCYSHDISEANFTDAQLTSFYGQLTASGISVSMETGALRQSGGAEAFNSDKPMYDRVIDNGGELESLAMQEPLTVARYNNWGNEFAANGTVDWIQLVRQNYPGIKIGSIEAYPYNSYSLLQWWLQAIQDRCAQRGIEGLDYFIIDCDWRTFPGSGNWTTVKNLENWCHGIGLAYSVIYWPCPHASSMNDIDFWTDINNQGTAYKNANGAPDEYDIQCWDYIPLNAVPETTNYTFTNGALRFINAYVPRAQTPYSGVIPLPGTIQAENFDKGGENVAYHDTTLGNTGGAYRISDSVDIEDTAGGVRNVGWVETGEWLEYTVNVASAGSYNIEVRVATPNSSGSFHIEMNGTNVTGAQTIPNTTDWHTWASKIITGVSLSAGQQTLRLAVDVGGWNVDYIYVRSASAPLDPVTSFTAVSGDTQVSLSWRNSSDSRFTGTMIRYNINTGYPTSPTNGTLLINNPNNPGTGDSYTHTGLTNGATYYYSAFAHDSASNYATKVDASAIPADVMPPGSVTGFAAVRGDSQNTLTWTNPGDADLAGVRILVKTTGYPSGPTDPTATVTYNAMGTNYVHSGLTNGVTYYYSAFARDEVPNYSSAAQANATPTDLTPPGPVTSFKATPADMQNVLSWVNPTDSDFTGTKILFKTTGYPSDPNDATATPVCDLAGTGYVHSGLTNGQIYYYSAYAHDAALNYSTRTTASGTPVYVPPPGPVTSFKTYGGNERIDLAWTNPTDPLLAGVKILCKASSGYPLSESDPSATVIYNALGTSYSHTGLTNGTKYYYGAYAYTTPTSFSTAAQSSTYAAAEVNIPTMKGLANSVIRAVKGNVVTAVFTGSFYIQDPLNPYGLKVSTTETPLPSIGQKVDVVGSMTGTPGNERTFSCGTNPFRVTDPGPITITPAALNNKAVGGANLNSYTLGVVDGTGANNVGLLVRVSGTVTQMQAGQNFYVDDGCGLKDGTKTSTIDNVGVRIKVSPPSGVSTGKYVVVTGIVSPLSAGGLRPQVLPLPQPAGVQVVGP